MSTNSCFPDEDKETLFSDMGRIRDLNVSPRSSVLEEENHEKGKKVEYGPPETPQKEKSAESSQSVARKRSSRRRRA